MEDDVLFKELFNKIEELPVVDCHEHILGPKREVTKREPPLASLIEGMFKVTCYRLV